MITQVVHSFKFNYVVSTALLVMAGIYQSPSFAWASVGSLLVALVADSVDKKLFAMKDIKLSFPEQEKKKIDDLVVRVQSLEYGVKARGF